MYAHVVTLLWSVSTSKFLSIMGTLWGISREERWERNGYTLSRYKIKPHIFQIVHSFSTNCYSINYGLHSGDLLLSDCLNGNIHMLTKNGRMEVNVGTFTTTLVQQSVADDRQMSLECDTLQHYGTRDWSSPNGHIILCDCYTRIHGDRRYSSDVHAYVQT